MFNNKILCLGNNGIDTDIRTSIIATENQTINHGLISDSNYIPQDFGYYHTSIADVYSGGLVQLAKQFDTVILLDQPLNEWSHWKLLLSTYKITSI